ncbi:MAG: 2-phospho-L-lactate guanylyltransferase [Pseudomonadales bacterium]
MPLKLLAHAKQRLAPELNPQQRQQLVLAMAADVLEAVRTSQRIDHILLISRNAEAKALARDCDAEIFAETEEADLPQALVQAIAYASNRNASGVCIIPADAPLIHASDVDQLLCDHQVCSVVPDAQFSGTNALVLTPPQVLEPIFDGRSFVPHIQAAVASGLPVRVFATPRFSLDIDTPEDLQTLQDSQADTHAKAYLGSV